MNHLKDYQALARLWRPRSFDEIVGQETIVRIITNALTQQRIHHAYLLTGTRGVGKTTIARIFAKCLNCETGITAKPCGICPTCISIDAGRCLDLHEIDAASRTKVEDTRELLDNVLYPPTQCRYKIYLIDEVHMLSNHSFNALLKTLEEPPAHVKFILATTDAKRLPITILSRCLQFHLTRITAQQISEQLSRICQAENIAADKEALIHLAQAADGSMRDALSLLDQAIAYGQGMVNDAEVRAMLGSITPEDVLPILHALANKSGEALFAAIAQLATHAPDFQQVFAALIDILHKMAVSQIVPQVFSNEAGVIELTQQFSPEDIQLYYQIALLGKRDLALHPNPQQGFEMTLLRMLAFNPLSVQAMTPAPTASIQASLVKQPPISAPLAEKPMSAVQAAPALNEIKLEWRALLPKLNLTGMTHALAQNCVLVKQTDTMFTLALAENHKPMLNVKLKDRLKDALCQYFKRPLQLDIQVADTTLQTPVKQAAEEQEKALAAAQTTILENQEIKEWVHMYDATVSISLVENPS